MSAISEVLENCDLIRVIVRRSVTVPPNSGMEAFHQYAIDRIRTCYAVATINLLFRQVATGFLARIMRSFQDDLLTFRNLAQELFVAISGIKEKWEVVAEMSVWASVVYGLDINQTFFEDGQGPKHTLAFDYFLESRVPETPWELLHMLERRCVCCGSLLPRRPFRAGPGAWCMHPYDGQLMSTTNPHTDAECIYKAGTWIPHTCGQHFVEVEFGYDGVQHRFGVGTYSRDPLQLEERQMHHFITAACREPWYESNIARLFSARAPELRPMEEYMAGPLGRRFVASICMYNPDFHNNEDYSVQSIFRLTRAQVRAMIRRGSAMTREQRLLK